MVIGIVAEWNPFHEGHAYLVRKAKAFVPGAPIICAMSGAFVQRGEPAIFDKWTRALWAVQNGVDIAVELPVLSVLQSADKFSDAGVRLLAGLGITHLAFGTESLGASDILSIADWMATASFQSALHQKLDEGIPYSKAVNGAISTQFPQLAQEIAKPNNLLGIQYARTIQMLSLSIQILPIHRDMERPISATAIRKDICHDRRPDHIPESSQEKLSRLLAAGHHTDYDRYDDACLLTFRTMTKDALTASGLFTEGLQNRWFKEMGASTYPAMLEAIKSKRYLYSRLRRIGAALLIGGPRTPSPFAKPPAPSYARILAMTPSASHFLKDTPLPIVTSYAKALRTLPASALSLAIEQRATDIQAWCMRAPACRSGRRDFYQSPVIVRDTGL